MEDANGLLKGSKPISGINGGIKTTLNGHTVGPRMGRTATRPGLLARSFNMVARLLTWYSIFTVLLRCPATLDACDETSPRICKPYFQLKQAVAPHIEPYYDSYAAPYVELVRPYYNTLDQKVIAPGWGYAKKHGAPRLEQAQAFAQAQWEKSVQPQITKGQQLAIAQYNQKLAPHVDRVQSTVSPYYDIARTNALQTYHEILLPSYEYVRPYAQRGYQAASAFTTGTVVPSALWAWNKTYVFLDSTVWPQLRIIYVENVEPQLIKIGKRLGRYSSGKKSVPKPPVAEVSASPTSKSTSSFVKPTPSVAPTASSPSAASSSSTTSTTTSATPSTSSSSVQSRPSQAAGGSTMVKPSVEPVTPPEIDEKLESEDPVRRTARETVAEDLKDWHERYAKAAEEATTEISNQVHDISKKMMRRNAKVVGKGLVEQLQTTIVSELVGLRRNILSIVGAVNVGSATPEMAQEQIVNVVRQAGMTIKEQAQRVRTWREHYEAEMQAAITKEAETHFAILQNIRDLALQKIGMKWAWMDGVTYKDWAKYHQLKDRFDEFKDTLQRVIVTHPSLEAAQLEAANVEDEAMKLAASAAKELARLKQVGAWKLVASDATTEFDSTLMQQAAEAAEAAKEAAAAAVEKVAEFVEDAKDTVVEGVKDAASAVAEGVPEAAESVSSAILPTPASPEEVAESASSVSELVEEATQVLEGTTAPSTEAEAPKPVYLSEEEAQYVAEFDTGAAILDNATEASPEVPEPAVVASEELSSVVEPATEATPVAEGADSEDAELEDSTSGAEVPVVVEALAEEISVLQDTAVGAATEAATEASESASSVTGTVASAVEEATEAAEETVSSIKDEL